MSFLSLILLILSPFFASLLIFTPFFANSETLTRRFVKSFSAIHLLYTFLFLFNFDFSSQNEIQEELKFFDVSWLENLGISATFSLDSLSLIMVILTSLIFFIAIMVSKHSIKFDYKWYYALMFLLETAVLGVFCAQDMFLFFMFWELELIPVYFLISKWGSDNAQKSATKFLLYTFLGSIFLLIGILFVYFNNYAETGILTSNIELISGSNDNLSEQMYLIFICFMIAFAVKLPIIPFHSWLPDAHSDAPTPVSIVLAAVLLKMGGYGLLRFNLGLFPDVFITLAPYLAIFAVINIIYGSVCAIVQDDIKKLIAYSSISNMGIFFLGMLSLNKIGLTGSIFQLVSHAFICAGLFIVAGIIYSAFKTRKLSALRGIGVYMPKLMNITVILSLAAAGVPLLSGFIGEFLCFAGSFTANWQFDISAKLMTALSLFVLIFSSVYILKFLHGVFYSASQNELSVKDVSGHKFTVLLFIVFVIFVLGLLPGILTDLCLPFVQSISDLLGV